VVKDLFAKNKMDSIKQLLQTYAETYINSMYAKIFIGIFVVLVILSLHTKFTRSRAKKILNNKCSKNAKTIFVIMLAHHDNATKALFDLFENADCPTNIKVSVYDITGTNCKESYVRMASRFGKLGESFGKNITVLKRFAHDQGDYAAIYTLLKHNYQNEEYMCITNDNIYMNAGWDTYLIQNTENNTVLTGIPDHFTVLDTFEDGLPTISLKKAARSSLFKMQYWSKHFSFSKSWKHSKTFYEKFMLGGTDILISSELTKLNYTFKSVGNVFKFVQQESRWKRDSKSMQASRQCIEHLKLNMPLEKLGIYPKLKPSCILGIVNESDKKEIELKYGHMADYVYMRDLRFNV